MISQQMDIYRVLTRYSSSAKIKSSISPPRCSWGAVRFFFILIPPHRLTNQYMLCRGRKLPNYAGRGIKYPYSVRGIHCVKQWKAGRQTTERGIGLTLIGSSLSHGLKRKQSSKNRSKSRGLYMCSSINCDKLAISTGFGQCDRCPRIQKWFSAIKLKISFVFFVVLGILTLQSVFSVHAL